MIKYLPHIAIDYLKWDACVSRSQNPRIYGFSWYLDVVSQHKWDALILNDYEAVMPLCYNRKWGLYYIYPPLFAQQLGIFSPMDITRNIFEEFFNNIPAKFKYVELTLPLISPDPLPTFISSIFNYTNIELDLSLPYEKLYQNYSTNLKRNLKKINVDKLILDQEISLAEVVKLFRNNKGLEYPDMGDKQYQTLLNLNLAATNHQTSQCVGIRDNTTNELLAGALFMISNGKIVFLFSGVSDTGRDEKAMFYLLDRVIELNSNKNMVLDFDGSSNKELARFYLSFGSKEVLYSTIKFSRLSPFLKWLKR